MKLLIILSLLFLTACNNAPIKAQEWMVKNEEHPELKVKDFEKDRLKCWHEAKLATSGANYGAFGSTSYYLNVSNQDYTRKDLIQECLHIKGWNFRDEPDDEWH